MARYRILERLTIDGNTHYVVQQRYWLIGWITKHEGRYRALDDALAFMIHLRGDWKHVVKEWIVKEE